MTTEIAPLTKEDAARIEEILTAALVDRNDPMLLAIQELAKGSHKSCLADGVTERLKFHEKYQWRDIATAPTDGTDILQLKSGKYEQGTSFLNRMGKHCCFGVLCEMAYRAGVVERRGSHLKEFTYGSKGDDTYCNMLLPMQLLIGLV